MAPPDAPVQPFLKSITLEGFLSFGPHPVEIPLTPLNVLIGPDGSGKSNFVEALSVLRAVPKDLPLPIRRGGGVKDWLWRNDRARAEKARVEVVVGEGWVVERREGRPGVRYRLVFGAQGDSFIVLDERVEAESTPPGREKPYLYFGYENGRPSTICRPASPCCWAIQPSNAASSRC